MTEILDRHPQIRVLSDDVYFFLPFDNRKYESFANFSPSNFEKTVTVFSAGKMLNCTGWKVGWMVGPKDLVAHAMFVHEATNFNLNVPGQIAIAKSLGQALNEPYEGHSNFCEYTSKTFEQARNFTLEMLDSSTDIKFKPTKCESGYFMPVDITEARQYIPEKYFQANMNYEEDSNTLVKQMQFVDNKVPLDFAFCRWFAIEKGVSMMPLSNFCLQESPHKVTNFARIAICKTPETFQNPELTSKFQKINQQ